MAPSAHLRESAILVHAEQLDGTGTKAYAGSASGLAFMLTERCTSRRTVIYQRYPMLLHTVAGTGYAEPGDAYCNSGGSDVTTCVRPQGNLLFAHNVTQIVWKFAQM